MFIKYFKGMQVKISIKWCTCISVAEDCFYLNNQTVQILMKCSISSGSSLFAKVPGYQYPEGKGLKIMFLTAQVNQMLWVIKRTFST